MPHAGQARVRNLRGQGETGMNEPVFFKPALAPTLADIAQWTGAKLPENTDAAIHVDHVAPIDSAGPGALTFLDNPRYAGQLAQTRATACLIASKYLDKVPAGTVALVVADPYPAFAKVVAKIFPDAMRPQSAFGASGISPGAFVHPEARLEAGVTVDPGAVIGPHAEIGSGTLIGAQAVIGPNVRIGRDCAIGPHASLSHCLIGNRVIVHGGARIGQDGFGFAMGPRGHLKVPQVGRVIIQDDVEIGANSTIDRGANRDTLIGEGTKIDNLVQIGHNVSIGRHCVVVAQAGVSGSTEIGDFAALGGQAGITGHLKIGAGAQVAAQSGVMNHIPAGARWGGSPAKDIREWFKTIAGVEKLLRNASKNGAKGSGDGQS